MMLNIKVILRSLQRSHEVDSLQSCRYHIAIKNEKAYLTGFIVCNRQVPNPYTLNYTSIHMLDVKLQHLQLDNLAVELISSLSDGK